MSAQERLELALAEADEELRSFFASENGKALNRDHLVASLLRVTVHNQAALRALAELLEDHVRLYACAPGGSAWLGDRSASSR